jgi:hypothetical protein
MNPEKCHILAVRLLLITRFGLFQQLRDLKRSFSLKRFQYHVDAALNKMRGIMKCCKVNLPEPATILMTVTVHSCEI